MGKGALVLGFGATIAIAACGANVAKHDAGATAAGSGGRGASSAASGSTGSGGTAGGAASCTNAVAVAPEGAVYLAVDADDVYWTDAQSHGSVWRAPKTGGTATLVAQSPPTMSSSAGLAVDATTVYWANGDGSAYSAPKAGGPVTTIVPPVADGAPSGVAIDDTFVYALKNDCVCRWPKGGGASKPIITAVTKGRLAVDSKYVYWIENGEIELFYKELGGGEGVLPTTPDAILAVTGDDSGFYGLDVKCNLIEFPVQTKPETLPHVLAEAMNEVNCGQLATDATHIYWSSAVSGTATPMTLFSLAKAGGERQVLLSCSPYIGPPAPGVAVDDVNVYWATNNPEMILRVPK
jgi:hypothetical protein